MILVLYYSHMHILDVMTGIPQQDITSVSKVLAEYVSIVLLVATAGTAALEANHVVRLNPQNFLRH